MDRRSHLVLSLVVFVTALAAARVHATGGPPAPVFERVFATSVNDKIVEVNFAAGTIKTVVTDPGSSFRGLAVRGDFRILVADHNGGGKVKIFDLQGLGATITQAIAFPSGLTVDADQNVFVTNAHEGRSDEVWRIRRDFSACLDGADPRTCAGAGYKAARKIDGPVKIGSKPTKLLADAKVLGSDLWVAVQDPPALIRYADAADCYPCTKKVAVGSQFLGSGHDDGLTPTSLTFTEDEILVATGCGRILRFDLARAKDDDEWNDAPLSPDFADAGARVERIAVGIQAGVTRAFVTLDPKSVRQYSIAASGVGSLLKSVSGLRGPVGVNLASSKAAVTTTGDDQEVLLTSLEATFETVTAPGLTDASCFSFVDPREAEPGAAGRGFDDPLHRDLALTDPALPLAVRELGYPNLIPSYVRAFRQPAPGSGQNEDNATGPPVFRFCQATTTAQFRTLVRVMGEGEPQWLGYDPDCHNEDPSRRPRFFYSEEPPEPVLKEGRVFINATAICNRDANDSWKMKSIYVTGARETRPPDNPYVKVALSARSDGSCKPEAGVVDCQLNRLKAVVDSMTCIARPFKTYARETLDKAIFYFDKGKYDLAKSKLILLERAVDCEEDEPHMGDFATCGTTEAPGELRSRARAAIFGVCDGFDLTCPCNQTLSPSCSAAPVCPVISAHDDDDDDDGHSHPWK